MIILVKREFFIISSIRKIFFPRVSVSIFLRLENRGGGDEFFSLFQGISLARPWSGSNCPYI